MRPQVAGSSVLLAALALFGACQTREGGDGALMTRTAEGRLVSTPADSAAGRKVSMVRIINALPGMNSVSISADANALFAGVDYKSVTPYTELRDNLARFRLRSGDRDTTVATNNELMADGSRYTVVALPETDGGVRLRVLHDELTPDAGKARIRIIHGIGGTGDIDIALASADKNAEPGAPLFEHVNFGAEAGYKEIDPAKGMLEIRADGTNRLLLRKELNVVAGHAYTVVVTGSGAKRVDAIIVDDQALGAR